MARMWCSVLVALVGAVSGCAAPPAATEPAPLVPVGAAAPERFMLQGFETPSTELRVVESASNDATTAPSAAPTTQSTPTTAPDAGAEVGQAVQRSSQDPAEGLWAAECTVHQSAQVEDDLPRPANFTHYDVLELQARHMSSTQHSGEAVAAAFAVDAAGHRSTGDSYPLTTRWQAIPLDLTRAADDGLDVTHIVTVGIAYRVLAPETSPALRVQTDAWQLTREQNSYVGSDQPNSFYVRRHGLQLDVGTVGHFRLTFTQASQTPGDPPAPWLTLRQGDVGWPVLGPTGTGLFVLDQDQFDRLQPAVSQQPDVTPAGSDDAHLPTHSWPSDYATWQWSVAWTSGQAALVEVRQTAGPFDRLGQPMLTVTWRFVIYQTGAAYVTVEPAWRDAALDTPAPVSLALVQPTLLTDAPPAAPNVLRGLYPPAVQGRALPHAFQLNAAVGMLAKTPASGESLYWQAEVGSRRVFGVGLPTAQRRSPIPLMLLLERPAPLNMAAAFSAYLAPPDLTFTFGGLDRTFPGDVDNDGFNDASGFQTIRMDHGRATFLVDPGNRPLPYPAFLLTVPADQRDQFGSGHARLLVNVDGQQLLGPPVWPDGSWLVQLPWVISKPVTVEAVAVPQ